MGFVVEQSCHYCTTRRCFSSFFIAVLFWSLCCPAPLRQPSQMAWKLAMWRFTSCKSRLFGFTCWLMCVTVTRVQLTANIKYFGLTSKFLFVVGNRHCPLICHAFSPISLGHPFYGTGTAWQSHTQVTWPSSLTTRSKHDCRNSFTNLAGKTRRSFLRHHCCE